MAAPLRDQMAPSEKHDAMASDTVKLLESEVREAGGMSGLAIKAGFKVLRGIQPGFVERVVHKMLPDFLEALDPLYQEALSNGQRPGARVEGQGAATADALLKVADGRVARSGHEVAKKTYARLRPSAQKHVARAAPRIAALLDRHADS